VVKNLGTRFLATSCLNRGRKEDEEGSISGSGKPYRSFGLPSLPHAVVERFYDTTQLRFARQLLCRLSYPLLNFASNLSSSMPVPIVAAYMQASVAGGDVAANTLDLT
jgi:hypothetical protein